MDFKWEKLKDYLINYKRARTNDQLDFCGVANRRYCIAISIDELLQKMDELEDESQAKAMYRRMADYITNGRYGGVEDERS